MKLAFDWRKIKLPTVWIDPNQSYQVAAALMLVSIGLFIMWWLSYAAPQGIAPQKTMTLAFAIALLMSSFVLRWQPKKIIPISLMMLAIGNLFVISTVSRSLFFPPNHPIYAVSFLSASTNYVLVLQVITFAVFQKGARLFGWGLYTLVVVLVLMHWLTGNGSAHPATIAPRVVLVITPLISLISLGYLVRWRDDAGRKELTMQQEKEKLMAMMSHEIRGQLQTTLSAGELLSGKVTDPVAKRALMRLTGVTLHLDRYLRDWVEFVRLDNPELSIESKHFNLITLIDQVVDDYKTTAMDQGLLIHGPHWQVLNPNTRLRWQTAQGDAVRIQQVLNNLIDNALKYTREGSVEVTIHVPIERANWAGISVTDSGPGIAAAQLPLVFQPFLRLNSHNNTIKGSGLGLAIAWRLMQRMGGSLDASSQVGKGSTFTMSFPLQPR